MAYLPTFTIKKQPNVGIYMHTPYMDPMGYAAMALKFDQAPPQAA